jgi:hypothetical protein
LALFTPSYLGIAVREIVGEKERMALNTTNFDQAWDKDIDAVSCGFALQAALVYMHHHHRVG